MNILKNEKKLMVSDMRTKNEHGINTESIRGGTDLERGYGDVEP